ncbi:MAG: aminopeptidase [Patescibacteria group bacterium]
MGSVRKGAKQAIETCLKVKENEKVVIITDLEAIEISYAIKEAVERITENIQVFVMEEFGPRPLSFPVEIGSALKKADVSLYVAQGAEGELQIFRGPMLEIVEANSRLRHGHMVGVTEQIMKEGMCSNYREIKRISGLVHQKVSQVKEIMVTARGGTNIIARFSSKIKWVVCDGNITSGHWSNLPDGEVFTCPVDVNGILVVDGCLGDYFDKKYGLLEKTPASVFIENGRAVKDSIRCANQELAEELAEYLFKYQNSNRVGEFALGTNIGLKRIIGNLLQDEKFPGIHLAFGGAYPEETGAEWDSDSHIDCVIQKPTVYLDGKVIMRGGKYVL